METAVQAELSRDRRVERVAAEEYHLHCSEREHSIFGGPRRLRRAQREHGRGRMQVGFQRDQPSGRSKSYSVRGDWPRSEDEESWRPRKAAGTEFGREPRGGGHEDWRRPVMTKDDQKTKEDFYKTQEIDAEERGGR
jgi:hypothetical protein